MQSSNPILTRADGFNGKNQSGYASFENTTYSGPPTHTGTGTGRMTIDTVVQKTGLTLGTVVLVAAATWVLSGDPTAFGQDGTDAARNLYVLSLVGSLGAFALSLVNSFKKVISPALVIAFAALEGLAVGAFSKVIDSVFDSPGQHGIVIGAVGGTVAAFVATLTVYKVFDIKVTDRFHKIVYMLMFGFVGISLFDFVLHMFHADLGINGFGGMGLLASAIGLGIGILMLVQDFDLVEKGIAAGLPERESWRAAFGLTVTIVWIYIELLRLIAILRGD